MQQFFGLVNSLLAGDPAAARRRLGMVTYKVVPFSPAAGLVQWVEHTIPLTDYLLGRDRRGGAFARWAAGRPCKCKRSPEHSLRLCCSLHSCLQVLVPRPALHAACRVTLGTHAVHTMHSSGPH